MSGAAVQLQLWTGAGLGLGCGWGWHAPAAKAGLPLPTHDSCPVCLNNWDPTPLPSRNHATYFSPPATTASTLAHALHSPAHNPQFLRARAAAPGIPLQVERPDTRAGGRARQLRRTLAACTRWEFGGTALFRVAVCAAPAAAAAAGVGAAAAKVAGATVPKAGCVLHPAAVASISVLHYSSGQVVMP